ncbi:hypothetical protein C9J60_06225 [Streptomyces sp. A244]|nr:hypothetical protein C9J60_06225 [Streptomyces sp. A244]
MTELLSRSKCIEFLGVQETLMERSLRMATGKRSSVPGLLPGLMYLSLQKPTTVRQMKRFPLLWLAGVVRHFLKVMASRTDGKLV